MVHSLKFKGVTLVLLFAALSVILCSARASSISEKSCYTRDGASLVAENFVKNDQTYKFDGLKDTLNIRVEHVNGLEDFAMPRVPGMTLAMTMPLEQKEYTFKAKFDCRHSGYGNRAGKYLAEVITSHEAEITVENCIVKSAILDGKWDMVTSKFTE
jgi:hypothetical protein